MNITHESISRRAHQIWIEAGKPDGKGMAHWLQAESELREQHAKTGEVASARGRSVEPPSAKHVSEKAPHGTDYAPPGVTTDSLHHRRNG